MTLNSRAGDQVRVIDDAGADALATKQLEERLFLKMQLIRKTEEALLQLFSEGRLSGTTHTSIGQEGIAAALGEHVRDSDIVFSTHRCHGHYLACGGAPADLFAELMGRNSSLCGGRGGSQYLHAGRFFSSGIQGGVPGVATGIALGRSLLSEQDAVTVAILGDGTLGEGLVYESLNFASLHSLPILFLLEHNGYAQSTPTRLQLAGTIASRAEAFGLPYTELDGDDVMNVHRVVGEELNRVRVQQAPALLVIRTYRLAPHSKGDDDRDPAEVEASRSRDPLVRLARDLGQSRAGALEEQARATVDEAIDAASATEEATPKGAPDGARIPTGTHEVPWPRDPAELGVRSLNRALHQLLDTDSNAFVMGEDILDPYGGAFKVTRGLSSRFQQRVIATPISEAGIAAWSTGAALAGARPVAELMFGDFLMLASDQIVNHAAKFRGIYGSDVSVPMVFRVPVGAGRGYGPTHSQSPEGMFLGVPGLVTVATSPLLDSGELLLRAAALDDPVLFIENKLLYAQPSMVPERGRIDQLFVRADGRYFPTVSLSFTEFEPPDVLIVAYGGQVLSGMDAMRTLLLEHEIACELVVPHQLSPAPEDVLVERSRHARSLVVVDEGPPRAGFAAMVASIIAATLPRRVTSVSGPGVPIPASKQVESQLLPSPERIVEAALSG